MTPTITASRHGLLATGSNSDFPKLADSKAVQCWLASKLAERLEAIPVEGRVS